LQFENNSGNPLQNLLKITSLNVGCQTTDTVYSSDHVKNLETQILELNKKIEKIKKEFNDYREKSHKVFLGSEENYNKLLKENENLKKEISELLTQANNEMDKEINRKLKEKNKINSGEPSQTSNNISNKFNKLNNNNLNNLANFQNNNNNIMLQYSQVNTHNSIPNDFQKINLEYLKNVLIKYLEAFAIGNEFQIKILENVIFTILNVSNIEKQKLEEKRTRSSFYYNLWYNAKEFLSAKIYGVGSHDSISGDNNEGGKENESSKESTNDSHGTLSTVGMEN
jgi:hypothetical protein